MTHRVHIIDKEPFDISRDYNDFPVAETLEALAELYGIEAPAEDWAKVTLPADVS